MSIVNGIIETIRNYVGTVLRPSSVVKCQELALTFDDTLECILEVFVAERVKERVERRVEVGQPERDGVDQLGHSLRVDGTDVKDDVKRHPANKIPDDEINDGNQCFPFLIIVVLVTCISLVLLGRR